MFIGISLVWLYRALVLAGLLALAPCPAADAERDVTIASPAGPGPGPSLPSEQKLPPALQKAKRLIESQRPEDALAALKPFVNATPRPPHLDQAYLLMAAAYKDTKQYNESIAALNFLLSEFPETPLLERAKLLLAMDHAALNHPDQSLPLLAEIRSTTTDANTKREALALTGSVLVQKRDPSRAIQAWLEEMELASGDSRDEVAGRIRTLIQEKLDRKALAQVRDTYPTSFPGDVALIRLINYYTARGEDHLAERQLRLFATRFPTHEYMPRAGELLAGLTAKLRGSQAILLTYLPLTGKLAAYGTDALNGVQVALEKAKDTFGQTSIGLIVKDSGAHRDGHIQDLAYAIEEYRPIAVIGPMVSRQLPAVSELADRTATPFVTPAATVSDVHRYGPYLFNSALTYPLQTKRLAEYAMGTLGLKRFCILHPDAAYGRELAALFAREVAHRDGEIIAVETYKEGDTDFGQAIKRIKAADLKKHGVLTPLTTSKGWKRDLYAPGFDAVFVPSRAADVALLAPQLVYHDIKVPLLGINSWNTSPPQVVTEELTEGSVFVDSFLLDSQDPTLQEFVERYKRRFQTAPSVFAAQAYDATSIILDAIRKGADTGHAVRDYLVTQAELPVLSGPARFDATGTLVRRVFVIGVKQRKFVQVE